MLYLFRKIAEKCRLWDFNDHLLIAVSGGLDSMVLLDLCRQLYNPITVVHCNFCLRGIESDTDEALVRKIAKEYDLKLHSKRFDTEKYAQEKGISIEMAARDLRYSYFQELCQEYNYTKILTAHHANDSAETVLLNLTKGTGIKGLTGIPRKRDNIVRPLLTFPRVQLQEYAKKQNLAYREDETNKKTVFQRNKIRHQVLPLLKEINPKVVETLQANNERLQEVRSIYEDYISNRLLDLVKNEQIEITALAQEKYPQSLLYEWLSPYGFSATVVDNILETLTDTEAKLFFTKNHRLIKSRGNLQIAVHQREKKDIFKVTTQGVQYPIVLDIQDLDGEIQKATNIAYFDAEKLQFPLQLRRKEEGDRFVPFGLKGTKKISEFFKNQKLTTLEKENTWLLCSGNDIIWIVGLRTDDRYKITKKTEKAIQITWKH